MRTNDRNNRVQQHDVLIVGGGPAGLYAALLLATMDVSVRIIDKKPTRSTTNPSLLLSPHTIQYLQAVGLADALIEKGGMRHWRFQTYLNQGTISVERQSYRVWDKKGAEFNWAMSVETIDLIEVLHNALIVRTGVTVEYHHELVNLQDMVIESRGTVDYPVIASIKDHSSGHVFCSRSRTIIGADGAESLVRRKLGLARAGRRKPCGNFYTFQVEPEGNFPGLRALSIIRKREDAVMLIGHRNKLHVILEENHAWSRYALLDSDSQLLEAVEAHVKSVLQPYSIRFNKVFSWRRWQASDGVTDAWSMHRRYFLVGSAAQSTSPAELLSANLGFDAVHNLCWKLALYLKHFASPHILDTYGTELASHAKDYHAVSDALLSLLSPTDYTFVRGQDNDRDSVSGTAENRMKRSNSWFIGTTPYPTNDVGQQSTAVLSGKLKPYTAQDLIGTSAIQGGHLSSTIVAEESGRLSVLSRSKSLSTLNLRQRSLSATYFGAPISSSSSGNDTNKSWSLRKPIFRSKTKVNTRGYQHYDMNSVVVAPHIDRWRFIRANQHSLLDRLVADRSPGAFTIVVFCTAINACQQALQNLHQYLDSSSSILQYEHALSQAVPIPLSPRPSSTATVRSSSGFVSTAGSRLSHFFSSRSSVTTVSSDGSASPPQLPPKTPVIMPTFGGGVTHTTRGDGDTHVLLEGKRPSFRLFSIMYITSSSRHQASQFFSETRPGMIRSMFPQGLDRVYFDHDNQTHSLYNITEPTILIIRPDDYIGAKIKIPDNNTIPGLSLYFDAFLAPPVDMDSAAADVAAAFCF